MEKNITTVFGKMPISPMLMVGASDARHYQHLCDRVYRFQPIILRTPADDRTHGVDERIETAQLPAMIAFNARMMQTWGSRGEP